LGYDLVMPELRLVGDRLRAVRALAENPVTRRALWALVSKDFHVAELEQLPAQDRSRVEEIPRPIAGAAPRAWGDGDLGAPEPVEGSSAWWRRAYLAGETTPREVAERLLERLDAREFGASTYSPFVAIDREGVIAAADASSARYRDGAPLGPLDGVVVPVKDEFHMRGLPTRGGTSWRSATVDEDAFIVTRLRNAGALLVGKAHATENGMNPLGYNPNFDYPRNVYSSGHGAGGSSTGSAVAVGLGLAPVAIATDGGGSIRLPAAMNGLFGLKPTFNRLSGTGDIWLGTVGHAGPIGRSAADLVDLLVACAARDPLDPKTHFANDWDYVYDAWRAALGRGIAGCRIGVLRSELRDAAPPIARACEDALRALEKEGAKLVDTSFPLLTMANAVGPIIIAGESAANACDDIAAHRHDTSDELRLVYGLMECITAQQHLRATRVRSRIREQLAETMAEVDLLALPAHARQAAPYALDENRTQIADTAWTASMTRFSFLANLTGVPAAAIPVGMHDGLPIALQLVGDAFDEASVIAGCAHCERMGITALPRPAGYRPLV
jgi:aspartyl-tRNA(Asn)/glutamyl-tRNA(Gln) amidotransferase subunit A